ncbi:TPA: hypothetical protein DD425_01450 [Candidatus Saccharibacteria bacterium]|nr:hypothetical protein [Candidatus Saccharibacteria bacterium]
MSMWAKQKGFTIVELLIVIVVIAILAAITIVAYTGIQQRARNAQTLVAVNAYMKAFAQYAALHSAYPSTGGANYSCLGENNPDDFCWRRTGTPPSADAMDENPTLNAELRTVMGTLPDTNPTLVGGRNGIMFTNHGSSGVTLDGVQHRYFIMYILEGTGTQCTAGQPLSGNWATFTSAVPASGITNTLSGGSECWVALPNPA